MASNCVLRHILFLTFLLLSLFLIKLSLSQCMDSCTFTLFHPQSSPPHPVERTHGSKPDTEFQMYICVMCFTCGGFFICSM